MKTCSWSKFTEEVMIAFMGGIPSSAVFITASAEEDGKLLAFGDGNDVLDILKSGHDAFYTEYLKKVRDVLAKDVD
jgi:hypothetical protein